MKPVLSNVHVVGSNEIFYCQIPAAINREIFTRSKTSTARYIPLLRYTFSIGLVILNNPTPFGYVKMYLILFKSSSLSIDSFSANRSPGV